MRHSVSQIAIFSVVLATVLSVDAEHLKGNPRSVCTGQPDGTFVGDDTSCLNFFVCYDGEPVSQSCSPASYFDSVNLYCLPDIDNICPQPQCSVDGAYSPNPDNCNLFYVCYDGKLVEQSCGPDSYFDSVNLYCLPDTNNICPQPQCSVNGAYSPNLDNCNLFYVCYDGQLVEQTCGPSSYFDSTNLYCLPDRENICPVVQCTVDGAFSPNPDNCNSFYVCYDGQLVEQSCGPGSYFDSVNLYCLPDTDNVCPQPQCSVDGAFSPNPDNCNAFYVCYDGQLVEQSCGPDSYFDSVNLYCIPDTDNVCPQPQCSVDGAFSPNPDNCNSFYVCYHGQLVEQSCGPGSYFDSTNLYCLPDVNNICPVAQCTVDGAFSPNPDNCNSFYVCYDGQLVEQSCGPGSYFDSTNLYCLPDVDNICPVAQCSVDGAFSPHPTECALFYVCYNGLLVEQTCGQGSYFDKTNLYCLPDTDNICWPSTTTSTAEPCTCEGGYTDGELIPSPDSCYSYYICSSGTLVEQNCGYGNYFDPTTKTCERDVDGECWPSSVTESTSTTTELSPCTCPGGYEEGDLVEDSDSCYSYFVCTQGQLVSGSCGTGNYFDSSTKTCVRDESGICWPTTTTSTSTTTTPAPCQCPGGYQEGDLVEDNNSCSSYFVCYQGELFSESCGTGNYFDISSKTCVCDESGICWPTTTTTTTTTTTSTSTTTTPAPCQCPGGYEEGDLVEDNDSCYSYFVCYQGELVSESCGSGNYFDSNSKICVHDESGICWPTTTTSTTTTTTNTTTTSTPAPCQCPGGYAEGDLVEDSDSCQSYFVCYQGNLVPGTCGAGNYFDRNSKTCVRDESGTCWPTTTTPLPTPCQCPGGYKEGDFVENPDNCYSFFVCTQAELLSLSCGSGNYFDKSSKNCVRDIEGRCWPITSTRLVCPGGYNEGEFVGSSDNCHSFYICTHGELHPLSCGIGNYFDRSSKICLSDERGICSVMGSEQI